MDADGGRGDGGDGPDRTRRRDRAHRRAIRGAGTLAGALSMLGASGHTGAADGEPEGGARPVCENVDPATDPNEWYRQLVADQFDLRDAADPGLDASRDDVLRVLREHNGGFDGHLLFFAANVNRRTSASSRRTKASRAGRGSYAAGDHDGTDAVRSIANLESCSRSVCISTIPR